MTTKTFYNQHRSTICFVGTILFKTYINTKGTPSNISSSIKIWLSIIDTLFSFVPGIKIFFHIYILQQTQYEKKILQTKKPNRCGVWQARFTYWTSLYFCATPCDGCLCPVSVLPKHIARGPFHGVPKEQKELLKTTWVER